MSVDPTLPSFLEPIEQGSAVQKPYINAIFPHKTLGVSAHAFWWPSIIEDPPTVLIFIPGNPGLIEFYTPFLTAIHKKTDNGIAILAHAHLGHSPAISQDNSYQNAPSVSLTSQVAGAIEVVDSVKSAFGRAVRIVVTGHSVGAWIALQVLRARNESVTSVFLLFPTIVRIADTPKGRALSWVFRSPLPQIISWLSIFTRVLSLRMLSFLFSDWPLAQVMVLRSLLNSPSCVYACLSMAHDEMNTIRELDVMLVQEHRHRLHVYFAEKDDWVGEQREVMLQAFGTDLGAVKIIHGHRDIPHAFCISKLSCTPSRISSVTYPACRSWRRIGYSMF
ncbi:hypothetical protein AcV5_004807 [Taiwanofungus camphoratus]|nr:hypothetical protein AcV5_004807 [Antrodia cinnamomea]